MKNLYNGSLSTLTDLYNLTMAYAYWKRGVHNQRAAYNLFYRKNPFGGHYTVCAGLQYVIDYIEKFKFDSSDLEYLESLNLFDKEFLNYLGELKFTCHLAAVPEGTVVFPNEPLLSIIGPILQCQLLETPLLNIINFQTLIATKAARICLAAGTDKVVEFGLRRAQGIDGALAASRACYIGGCAATSNVLAGKLFGIPVVGTHAHSWVMSFPSEEEAFEAYAEAMPSNSTFLVDTYNTKTGIENAIVQGHKLKSRGFELNGVRLDSGNLLELSIMARAMLDEAGFASTSIIASNDLDEYEIARLKSLGARIDVWGVGTNMVTGGDQSALGGVYKLGAIRKKDGGWRNKIKLSEDSIKSSNPGILDTVRLVDFDGYYEKDIIINRLSPPYDIFRPKFLLKTIFDGGNLWKDSDSLDIIRARREKEFKKFKDIGSYRVELGVELAALKQRMIDGRLSEYP